MYLPPLEPQQRDPTLLDSMLGLQRVCSGWSHGGLGAITGALHPFNPTTFKQLCLPIRIVAYVVIVILFSKASPLSVSL